MAGGMKGGGVPLHARVRHPDPAAAPAPPACPVRHCWVTTPVDDGPPRPGLLLEWRRDECGRWEGRVAYAALLRPGRWSTVEEWLPAEALAPPGGTGPGSMGQRMGP